MHSSWETASGQQLQVCSLYTVTHSLTRRGWGNQLCPLLSCDWLHMPSASSWKTVRGVTPVWTFVGWCSVPWGICCLFYIEGMRLCVCIMTCVPVCLLLLLNHSPHRRHPWKHVEVSGVTDCSLCVCAKRKSLHKGKIVCSNSLIAPMYLLLMCRNIIYHSDIVNSVFSDNFFALKCIVNFLTSLKSSGFAWKQ